MSQQKLAKTINKELRQINEVIDMKIIHGTSYARESRRHKLLVSMLREVKPQPTRSWSFTSFLF